MEPYKAWRTPIDEIGAAYSRKVKWQNAINGVVEKPEPDQREVAAKLRGFAAWHNAKMKEKARGGMGR